MKIWGMLYYAGMKGFVKKISAYVFFDQFMLVFPVYSIMFSDNGISISSIAVLFAIWAITTLMLEIPLGIVADHRSRKSVLMVGRVVQFLVFLTWLLIPTFAGYAFGFFLWGIASALKSGTFAALVYDRLKFLGEVNQYEKVSGKTYAFGSLGVALALGLGGFVAELGYEYVLIASLIGVLISMVVLASVEDSPISKSTKEKDYLKFLFNVFVEMRKDKKLMMLIATFVLVYGLYANMDEFMPLFFTNMGAMKYQVGLLGFVGYLTISLAGVTVSNKVVTRYLKLPLILVSSAFLYLIFFFLQLPYLIILLFPAGYLLAIGEIKLLAQMQKQIDSDKRATVISINSMIREIFGIFITLLMGYVAGFDIWYILLIAGVVFAVALVPVLYLQKNNLSS